MLSLTSAVACGTFHPVTEAEFTVRDRTSQSKIKVFFVFCFHRCVSLRRTTWATTESWACACAGSLREEVPAKAPAGEARQRESSSSVGPAGKPSWSTIIRRERGTKEHCVCSSGDIYICASSVSVESPPGDRTLRDKQGTSCVARSVFWRPVILCVQVLAVPGDLLEKVFKRWDSRGILPCGSQTSSSHPVYVVRTTGADLPRRRAIRALALV